MTTIALIDGSTVLQTWNAPNGEVTTRYTLPDGSQISPVLLGWASGDYAVVEVIPFDVPEGKQIVGSPSYAVSDGVVIETYQVEDIPPPPIPDRVSSRQFKMQLQIDGLLASVESWIGTQNELVQIAYHNSGTFVRGEPMMAAGFSALGFTENQIDQFFTDAEAL